MPNTNVIIVTGGVEFNCYDYEYSGENDIVLFFSSAFDCIEFADVDAMLHEKNVICVMNNALVGHVVDYSYINTCPTVCRTAQVFVSNIQNENVYYLHHMKHNVGYEISNKSGAVVMSCVTLSQGRDITQLLAHGYKFEDDFYKYPLLVGLIHDTLEEYCGKYFYAVIE